MSDPITRIAQAAMTSFSDVAARRGLLPLSEDQLDAAVSTLRAELKDLLTDGEIRAAVEAGNGLLPDLAFRALVGAAIVAVEARS